MQQHEPAPAHWSPQADRTAVLRRSTGYSAGLYPSPSAALWQVRHTVIMSQHCGETT
jgi:hypothetical protein